MLSETSGESSEVPPHRRPFHYSGSQVQPLLLYVGVDIWTVLIVDQHWNVQPCRGGSVSESEILQQTTEPDWNQPGRSGIKIARWKYLYNLAHILVCPWPRPPCRVLSNTFPGSLPCCRQAEQSRHNVSRFLLKWIFYIFIFPVSLFGTQWWELLCCPCPGLWSKQAWRWGCSWWCWWLASASTRPTGSFRSTISTAGPTASQSSMISADSCWVPGLGSQPPSSPSWPSWGRPSSTGSSSPTSSSAPSHSYTVRISNRIGGAGFAYIKIISR